MPNLFQHGLTNAPYHNRPRQPMTQKSLPHFRPNLSRCQFIFNPQVLSSLTSLRRERGRPADAAMNVSFVDNASRHQYFSEEYGNVTTAQLCLSSHYVNMNSERNYMAKAEEEMAKPTQCSLACRDEQFFGMKLRAPLYATRARARPTTADVSNCN